MQRHMHAMVVRAGTPPPLVPWPCMAIAQSQLWYASVMGHANQRYAHSPSHAPCVDGRRPVSSVDSLVWPWPQCPDLAGGGGGAHVLIRRSPKCANRTCLGLAGAKALVSHVVSCTSGPGGMRRHVVGDHMACGVHRGTSRGDTCRPAEQKQVLSVFAPRAPRPGAQASDLNAE